MASAKGAVLGGGDSNRAAAPFTSISGGYYNTVLGPAATVAGGYKNVAHGAFAFIGGGKANTATGNFSVAMGKAANAIDDHAIVLSFSEPDGSCTSAGAGSFSLCVDSGAYINGVEIATITSVLDLQAQLQTTENSTNVLATMLTDLDSFSQDLYGYINSLTSTVANTVDDVYGDRMRIDNVENTTSVLTAAASFLEARAAASDVAVSDLDSAQQELVSQLTSFENAVATLAAQAEYTIGNVSNNTLRIERLEAVQGASASLPLFDDLDARVSANEQSISGTASSLTQLQLTVNGFSGQITNNKNRLENVALQLASTSFQLANVSSSVGKTRDRVSNNAQAIAAQTTEISTLDDRVLDLEQSIASLVVLVQELVANTSTLRAEAAARDSVLTEVVSNVTAVRRDVQDLTSAATFAPTTWGGETVANSVTGAHSTPTKPVFTTPATFNAKNTLDVRSTGTVAHETSIAPNTESTARSVAGEHSTPAKPVFTTPATSNAKNTLDVRSRGTVAHETSIAPTTWGGETVANSVTRAHSTPTKPVFTTPMTPNAKNTLDVRSTGTVAYETSIAPTTWAGETTANSVTGAHSTPTKPVFTTPATSNAKNTLDVRSTGNVAHETSIAPTTWVGETTANSVTGEHSTPAKPVFTTPMTSNAKNTLDVRSTGTVAHETSIAPSTESTAHSVAGEHSTPAKPVFTTPATSNAKNTLDVRSRGTVAYETRIAPTTWGGETVTNSVTGAHSTPTKPVFTTPATSNAKNTLDVRSTGTVAHETSIAPTAWVGETTANSVTEEHSTPAKPVFTTPVTSNAKNTLDVRSTGTVAHETSIAPTTWGGETTANAVTGAHSTPAKPVFTTPMTSNAKNTLDVRSRGTVAHETSIALSTESTANSLAGEHSTLVTPVFITPVTPNAKNTPDVRSRGTVPHETSIAPASESTANSVTGAHSTPTKPVFTTPVTPNVKNTLDVRSRGTVLHETSIERAAITPADTTAMDAPRTNIAHSTRKVQTSFAHFDSTGEQHTTTAPISPTTDADAGTNPDVQPSNSTAQSEGERTTESHQTMRAKTLPQWQTSDGSPIDMQTPPATSQSPTGNNPATTARTWSSGNPKGEGSRPGNVKDGLAPTPAPSSTRPALDVVTTTTSPRTSRSEETNVASISEDFGLTPAPGFTKSTALPAVSSTSFWPLSTVCDGPDVDNDGVCDEVDSCPLDSINDGDGDSLCADSDPCALDPLNQCGSAAITSAHPTEPTVILDGGAGAETNESPMLAIIVGSVCGAIAIAIAVVLAALYVATLPAHFIFACVRGCANCVALLSFFLAPFRTLCLFRLLRYSARRVAQKLPRLGHHPGRHTITPAEPPGAMSRDDGVVDEDVLFHNACAEGNLTKVQHLLLDTFQERTSIIDHPHPVTGVTPLVLAIAATGHASRSNISTVKLLLEQGASVNLCANSGDTPLVAACAASNPRVAHVLLRFGAQPNQSNSRYIPHNPVSRKALLLLESFVAFRLTCVSSRFPTKFCFATCMQRCDSTS